MLASASTDSSLGAPPAPERDFEAAWPAWMRAISSVTLGAAAGAAGPTERHDGASSQSFPPARFRTKYRHSRLRAILYHATCRKLVRQIGGADHGRRDATVVENRAASRDSNPDEAGAFLIYNN